MDKKIGILFVAILLMTSINIVILVINLDYAKQFNLATDEDQSFNPFFYGWKYRKKITIEHTKVDGTLTNFPILISRTDVGLRDKTQDDGDDILFMDDKGVANKLYHEIEYFDDAIGKFVAWAKIPSLKNNFDTVIYMYYGNPYCVNQQSPEWVWDSDYVMIQHMVNYNDMIYDSTNNNNDGIIHGATWKTGIIGPALHFDGDDDYVSCLPNEVFDMDFPVTLDAWIYKQPGGGFKDEGFDGILFTDRTSDIYSGYVLNLGIEHENKYEFEVGFGNGKGEGYPKYRRTKFRSESIEPNTYYKLTGIIKGPNDINLFVNGLELEANYRGDANIVGYKDGPCVIGNTYVNDHNFHGIIDEVRISEIARSPDWISTEYNNQNDPLSFLSFGPEETGS